jgi:pimeloyl-ACP methyl ester carboxylesterase
MAALHEEIVFTPSEDQRWMAGVLMRPNDDARRPVGVICIHGATGAYYVPTYVYLGRALAERGYLCLSGNTRAHDIASMDAPWPLSARPEAAPDTRLGGTGWSRFEEVAHDVAGWIEYVVGQGVEQVVLFGHSAGVTWTTYYQAQRQDPRVVGLILASGADRVEAQDPARVKLAEELVAQGKGDAALPLLEGVPAIFALESAHSVVDWERVAGPFAVEGHTPWITNISVPILATMGTLDFIPNLHESLEGMRARAPQAPRFDLQVFDGADHLYTGQERELARVVGDWLDQMPAAQRVTRRSWWNRK